MRQILVERKISIETTLTRLTDYIDTVIIIIIAFI